MNQKEFIKLNLDRLKSGFINQYGELAFGILKIEVLNSQQVLKFYSELSGQYFPLVNEVLNVAKEVPYVNQETVVNMPVQEAYEKKLDYLFMSAQIILENWMDNLLPNQNPHPAGSGEHNIEMGWVHVDSAMKEMDQMYNALEEKYKSEFL